MQWDLGLKGLGLLTAMSLRVWRHRPAGSGEGNDPLAVADRRGGLLHRRPVHQRGLVRVGDPARAAAEHRRSVFRRGAAARPEFPGIATVLVIRHVTRRNRRRSTDVASKRSGTPGVGRHRRGVICARQLADWPRQRSSMTRPGSQQRRGGQQCSVDVAAALERRSQPHCGWPEALLGCVSKSWRVA